MEFIVWFFALLISVSNSEVIQLTTNNIKTVLESNELVLVDFYASWCYFSNVLDPIFTDASNKLENEFKDKGKVSLAKVDCERESDLARQYGIRKYPTLKLFRFGEVCKREYRGARNSEAFVEFINAQIADPIKELGLLSQLVKETGKSYLIGHFKSKSGTNYDVFRKIAYQLRDECHFYIQIIPEIASEKLTLETSENVPKELMDMTDVEVTKQWILKACTPVVRSITFQNAEDITEEGLPLILLFYSANHDTVTGEYKKFVLDHLMNETKTVNFVYADGQKFAHPLMHLGKTEADLPLIAVDSFQHMFVLPATVDAALKDPSILQKFVADLHSGRLHREFHNGPDPVPDQNKQLGTDQKPHNGDSHNHDTTPIPSVFKKLRPNSNRYTLFHDEF